LFFGVHQPGRDPPPGSPPSGWPEPSPRSRGPSPRTPPTPQYAANNARSASPANTVLASSWLQPAGFHSALASAPSPRQGRVGPSPAAAVAGPLSRPCGSRAPSTAQLGVGGGPPRTHVISPPFHDEPATTRPGPTSTSRQRPRTFAASSVAAVVTASVRTLRERPRIRPVSSSALMSSGISRQASSRTPPTEVAVATLLTYRPPPMSESGQLFSVWSQCVTPARRARKTDRPPVTPTVRARRLPWEPIGDTKTARCSRLESQGLGRLCRPSRNRGPRWSLREWHSWQSA